MICCPVEDWRTEMLIRFIKSDYFYGTYYVKMYFPHGIEICAIHSGSEIRDLGKPQAEPKVPDSRALIEFEFHPEFDPLM